MLEYNKLESKHYRNVILRVVPGRDAVLPADPFTDSAALHVLDRRIFRDRFFFPVDIPISFDLAVVFIDVRSETEIKVP